MGRTLNDLAPYRFETDTRLTPVEEERLREAIRDVERECFRLAVSKNYPRLLGVWVTMMPPRGAAYLDHAHVILRARVPARVRAKRRRIWWLPWRRGGRR